MAWKVRGGNLPCLPPTRQLWVDKGEEAAIDGDDQDDHSHDNGLVISQYRFCAQTEQRLVREEMTHWQVTTSPYEHTLI